MLSRTQTIDWDIAARIAAVRAQLQPIPSRSALLDSYRRESICRMAPVEALDTAVASVIEIAYSLRWSELPDELPDELPYGGAVEAP